MSGRFDKANAKAGKSKPSTGTKVKSTVDQLLPDPTLIDSRFKSHLPNFFECSGKSIIIDFTNKFELMKNGKKGSNKPRIKLKQPNGNQVARRRPALFFDTKLLEVELFGFYIRERFDRALWNLAQPAAAQNIFAQTLWF